MAAPSVALVEIHRSSQEGKKDYGFFEFNLLFDKAYLKT
jgi:hypothetical protein